MSIESPKVWIIDSTLRDGEQAPGVAFSLQEKREIARMLSSAGVAEIECGVPAMGEQSCQDIRSLLSMDLSSRLTGWCRAKREDLVKALECGLRSIHIAFPISPLHQIEAGFDWKSLSTRFAELIPFAREAFDFVSVGAQDASRTTSEFLEEFATLALRGKVNRIRLADTVGIWNPLQVQSCFHHLRQLAPDLQLEFHGHNDLGMAVGNAITALQSGADCVSVTVNGLGERAGNAPLEQVVVALQCNLNIETGIDAAQLPAVCQYVASAARRSIPEQQPVTGKYVFMHESGIHTSGQLYDSSSYQPFAAELVGREESEVVIGHHSGSKSIVHFLREHGVICSREVASSILPAIRQSARMKKRSLLPEEVVEIFRRHVC